MVLPGPHHDPLHRLSSSPPDAWIDGCRVQSLEYEETYHRIEEAWKEESRSTCKRSHRYGHDHRRGVFGPWDNRTGLHRPLHVIVQLCQVFTEEVVSDFPSNDHQQIPLDTRVEDGRHRFRLDTVGRLVRHQITSSGIPITQTVDTSLCGQVGILAQGNGMARLGHHYRSCGVVDCPAVRGLVSRDTHLGLSLDKLQVYLWMCGLWRIDRGDDPLPPSNQETPLRGEHRITVTKRSWEAR